MTQSKKQITYTEAIAEVEQILSQMRSEQISVDELEQKVKRASTLIEQCRQRLYKVEQGLEELLKQEQ
jgi:exodeoxyribonuclease VII small subunit